MSPGRTRDVSRASFNAIGMDAAEVLPWVAMFNMTWSSARPRRDAAARTIRSFA